MTKIAELKDKGAVVAWSPIGGSGGGEYADVIALGSKVRGQVIISPDLQGIGLAFVFVVVVGWLELFSTV